MDGNVNAERARLRSKRNFFDTFNDLGRDNDDLIDPTLQASEAILRNRVQPERASSLKEAAHPRGIRAPRTVAQPRRSEQTSDVGRLSNRRADLAWIRGSPGQSKQPRAAESTTVSPPPSAMPRAPGKSKAPFKLVLVPPEKQIFSQLYFYFLPNNDSNAGRRLKIIKALEYGASWQKDWNPYVTHIIVDKAIRYHEVLSFLSLAEVPKHVHLVNETWPAECISFTLLVDTAQRRFFVPDMIMGERPQVTETAISALSSSPALKPAGRDVIAKPASTPRSTPQQQVTQIPSSPELSVVTHQHFMAEVSASSPDQELQAAISQIKQLVDVPIDNVDDDDEEEHGNTDERPGTSAAEASAVHYDGHSSNEDTDATHQTKGKGRGKVRSWQDGFQCMDNHTGQDEGCVNEPIIKVLQQMVDLYIQSADEWRTRAYRMAIATLRRHPTLITTKEEALALPKVGQRLAEKIEEIATTHRLRRLENARNEPTAQSLQTFLCIYGVGKIQAVKWVEQGFRTINDLLSGAKLTTNQRIGIERYEDFNLRIPRAEVKRLGDVVSRALRSLDDRFEVIIGGSYRRGSTTSGDIDCMITHPSHNLAGLRAAVGEVVRRLTAQGFFTAALSVFSADEGSKWHGACCLPGSKIWRRIDLLLVPMDEMGAAKIYFTGNDIFNRSIRLLASKKGMRLNQYGLWKDVIRGENRERITQGVLLEGRDERKIFEILGVPWREPHQRNP